MYISIDHHSTISDDFCLLESFIECLGVECTNDHRRYLFMCVYRPPRGNVSDFLKALSEILATANDKKYSSTYVFGDFNLDLLKYDNAHVFEFINIMFCYSLFPLITRPTRITDTTASLIDHIWASNVEPNISNYIIKTDITDHFPVVSQFKFYYPRQPRSIHVIRRIVSQTALINFSTNLSQLNWTDILELDCPNIAFNAFFQKFDNLFQKYFPEKIIVVTNKIERSPHITPALRNSIKEKHRLERLSHKWPLTFKEKYKQYRNKLTTVLREAKNNYYKQQLKDNQGDPKSHWKSINSILGKNQITNHNHEIELKPCNLDISNKFNDHFLRTDEHNYIHDSNHLRYLSNPPAFSMYLPPTSPTEIEGYLRALKTSTPGYDDISPKILKHTSTLVSTPLSHIINLSLSAGIFPNRLKKAKVIPIHKSGSKRDINNYRPISILPAFSKIFEKVITTRLIDYLEKKHLLSEYQHGFRANHSTESAIIQFTNNVYKYLEIKHHVVGIFIDLSKAFDSLNHRILLEKLEHYGIRGVPLQLFESYLSNRSQSVYCNGNYSTSKFISKGVPQGSLLGPILFLVYINDIVNASSKFQYTIYADDTNLLLADKDVLSLHRSLTTELHFINQWIQINKLKLNISKTNYILFQNRSLDYHLPPVLLEGEILKNVSHTKFLGVVIDKNLNWNYQINNVYLKLSRMCGMLYKVRNHLTTEAMLSIYYTLCYPHLIYCVSVWACTWPSFLTKLKIVQNKILRCIFYLGKFESTATVYSEHKLLKFYSIHKCFLLLFIFKNITYQQGTPVFKSLETPYRTRNNSSNLVCPQYRTTLFKYSIFYFGPKLWNSLPNDINTLCNSSSILQFKIKIKKHLLTLQNL